MDIAKIRNKAKQRSKVEPAIAKAQPPQDQEIPQDSSAPGDELENHAPRKTTAAKTAGSAVDGLDQLFAATEEFTLTTGEAYADILDNLSDGQSQSWQQYLAFHLGREEYALDITGISEIIKVREFTDIPRAPKYILGIISLRGVVVPVFDLRLRLNLGASEILPTSRIVVSQLDDMTIGLLVDSINQVVNLSEEELEPPPGVLSGLDREMIHAIGRYQERMIILLNLKNILAAELN